jgi:hypothetical protein
MRGSKFSRLSHCEQGVEAAANGLAVFYQRVTDDQSNCGPRGINRHGFTTRLPAAGPSPRVVTAR